MSNSLASSSDQLPLPGPGACHASGHGAFLVEMTSSSTQMLRETGVELYSAATSTPASLAPPSIGQGIDLIWRHGGTGQVLGWFMDELQVESSHLLGDVVADSHWQLEGTGDFNGDGQEDLLWHHRDAGQVVVWYMDNGDLQHSEQLGYVVTDPRWKVEGVGDFNQDGHDDILWRHYGSGQVLAWEMDGAGHIQQSRLINTVVPDLSWRIEGIGDFNGDGMEDLLWRHYGSGQNVAFHLNAEGNVVSSALIGPVVSDLNWEIKGVGDFNGDGETDILLRHGLAGQNLAWLMEASQVLEAQPLGPSVPDVQWVPIVSRRSLIMPGHELLEASGPDTETDPNITIVFDPTVSPPATPSRPPTESAIPPDPTASVPGSLAPSLPDPAPVPKPHVFNIEFDYSFDIRGWFTPERRAALEVAASVWESILQDDFATTPAGTVTPFVINPETGAYAGRSDFYTTKTDIDDLRIFVGARAMAENTLGEGGASGYYTNTERYVGPDFEPWIGSIAFNHDKNWFFDPTPETDNDIPFDQSDFISTAVHEIGHVLGFNRSIEAFSRHLNSAGDFAGPRALASNGGVAIPLEGSHIEDGYEFAGSGETVLDPTSYSGRRQLPTVLDIAIFDDLGYEVDYSQAFQNISEAA